MHSLPFYKPLSATRSRVPPFSVNSGHDANSVILNKLNLFLSLWRMIHFLLAKYFVTENVPWVRDIIAWLLPVHLWRSQHVHMSEINVTTALHSFSCNLRAIWSFPLKRKHLAGLPHTFEHTHAPPRAQEHFDYRSQKKELRTVWRAKDTRGKARLFSS